MEKEEKPEEQIDFDILSLGLTEGEKVEEEEAKDGEEQGEHGEEAEEEATEEEEEKTTSSQENKVVEVEELPQKTEQAEEDVQEEEEPSKPVVMRDFCADLEGEGVGEGEMAKGELFPEDERASYAGFALETASVSEPSEMAFDIEEILVEVIPGIGAIVPKELVEAVVEYMKLCASRQHGMVMPRNIRHYSCPPLEVFD